VDAASCLSPVSLVRASKRASHSSPLVRDGSCMLRALRRRFFPWDLVIVVAGSMNSWWVLGRVYGIGVGSGGGVTRWRDGESALLKSLVR
jgi:hypothetical protein